MWIVWCCIVPVRPMSCHHGGYHAMVNRHASQDGLLVDSIGGRVRVVSNYGVGYDHVDADAMTARGITVGNTPG
eukprot:m.367157 g.367157  ORF g.367157 m.367157 type:complete len:74 (-) comp28100_c0_seq5:158-379(-)